MFTKVCNTASVHSAPDTPEHSPPAARSPRPSDHSPVWTPHMDGTPRAGQCRSARCRGTCPSVAPVRLFRWPSASPWPGSSAARLFFLSGGWTLGCCGSRSLALSVPPLVPARLLARPGCSDPPGVLKPFFALRSVVPGGAAARAPAHPPSARMHVRICFSSTDSVTVQRKCLRPA